MSGSLWSPGPFQQSCSSACWPYLWEAAVLSLLSTGRWAANPFISSLASVLVPLFSIWPLLLWSNKTRAAPQGITNQELRVTTAQAGVVSSLTGSVGQGWLAGTGPIDSPWQCKCSESLCGPYRRHIYGRKRARCSCSIAHGQMVRP